MRKYTPILLLWIFALAIVAEATPETPRSKETRDLPEFNSISLRVSGNVYLKQGSTQKVEIEGSERSLEEIETRVVNRRLIIEWEGARRWFSWSNHGSVDIYITVKDIRKLSVGGSGTIQSESNFNVDDLELSVSGSGRIEFEANADDVDISISGSGKIELDGSSNDNQIHISGSGRLYAADMKARSYDVRISGSGSCRINVSSEIYASISGSGSVYYRGDPDKVRSNVSGSGKLRRM